MSTMVYITIMVTKLIILRNKKPTPIQQTRGNYNTYATGVEIPRKQAKE